MRTTPPAVASLLADRLRSSRDRYLPPGRYAVEVAASGARDTTRLVVKPPKAFILIGRVERFADDVFGKARFFDVASIPDDAGYGRGF